MLNPIKWLFGLNRLLLKLEGFLLVFTLIVMLIFASLQVILRNFFDTGLDWGDVFARHLVLWVGFFGATLATNDGTHIRIDALARAIPKKWQVVADIFVISFCIIVSLLLAQAAYKFIMFEKTAGTILFEGIPTWYFMVIIPVGFGIIGFRYLIFLIEKLFEFGGKKIPEPKPFEKSEIEVSVKVKLK